MTAHKIVALIAVVCLVFSASSATAFADSTPTADVTPYPWYTSPPMQPVHLDGAFSAYYLKYSNRPDWSVSSYIDSSGSFVSQSNRATSSYLPVIGGLDKMVTLYNVNTSRFINMVSVAFYDSDYNFISNQGIFPPSASVYNFSIPDVASYVRISAPVSSSSSASQLKSAFRVLISPSFVSFDGSEPSSDFWRDYIYSHPYIISGSTIAVSLTTGSYPVDELFLDFQFSVSFIPCDLVSCSLFTQVKDGGYNNDFYPVDYNNRDDHTQVSYALFNPYYFDSDGLKVFCSRNSATQRNNPFTPSVRIEEGMFSGFTFVVPLNKPDGLTSNSVVFVQLSDLTINYNDVVVDSIDSLSEMDRISSQLQLPTPDTGVIFDNLNITVQQMQNTDFYNVDWFGPTGGILMTMLVTVFTFAALGYILFGKKG